jgi:hypothetical protein
MSAEKDEEGGAGGFSVTDRRIFADDKGTARIEESTATAAPESAPTIDFHTFVLSLGSSALMHLGELEQPGAGVPEKDLPLAKHTIDILVMLQGKTRGNLTADEDKLLDNLLYDLRLRFVESSKAGKPAR